MAEAIELMKLPADQIPDVLKIEPVDVRGTKGDRGGKFVYEEDRALRWTDEKDLWVHGYWFWDIQDASGDAGLAFRWKRTISSVDSWPDSIELNTDQGHSSEYWASPAGGGGRAANVGATVIDTNTGSTSAHTYTLQHRHYNVSGVIWVGGNRWDNVRWSVVLQEIKG